jgi:capsid assembly protease
MAQTTYALDPEHDRWHLPQEARSSASLVELESAAKSRLDRENDPKAVLASLEGVSAAKAALDDRRRLFAMSGKVAVIPIVGPIARYSTYDWWSGSYTRGTSDLMASIAAANEDAAVNSLLLYIDSPGGTVDGTSELYNAILRSAKPVHACIAGTCASAAYWVASACSKIWSTSANNVVGSIGVYVLHSDYSKMMQEYGITQTYIVSPGSVDKVVAPSNAPLSEEDKAKVTADLLAIRENFKADVVKGRKGVAVSDAVWTARAVNSTLGRTYGLIDGIKNNPADIVREAQASGTQASKPKKDTEMSLYQTIFGKKEDMSSEQQAALEKLQSEVAAADNKLTQTSAQLTVAKESAALFEAKAKNLEASLAEAHTKADASAKEVADLTASLATANAAAEAKGKELEAANATIAELNAKLAAATAPDTQAEASIAALKAAAEKADADADAAKLALEQANERLAKAGTGVPAAAAQGASDLPPVKVVGVNALM